MGDKLTLSAVILASGFVAGCSGLVTSLANSVGMVEPDVELDERISRNGVPASSLQVIYRDNAEQKLITNEFYSFEWCGEAAKKLAAAEDRPFDGDCLNSDWEVSGSVHFDGDKMTYSR